MNRKVCFGRAEILAITAIAASFLLEACTSSSTSTRSTPPPYRTTPSIADDSHVPSQRIPACDFGTFKNRHGYASCAGGNFRMFLKHPRDDEEVGAVANTVGVVSVQADVTSSGGIAGVTCGQAGTKGSDYYAFVVRPDTGEYSIVKTTPSIHGQELRGGRDSSVIRAGTDLIRGECSGGAGTSPTVLTMWVNGHRLTQVDDAQGFGTFDSIGLIVLSLEKGGIEADFANARVG
jgi:hypothetical protein